MFFRKTDINIEDIEKLILKQSPISYLVASTANFTKDTQLGVLFFGSSLSYMGVFYTIFIHILWFFKNTLRKFECIYHSLNKVDKLSSNVKLVRYLNSTWMPMMSLRVKCMILFSSIFEEFFNFIGIESNFHIWAYIHVLSIERASLRPL